MSCPQAQPFSIAEIHARCYIIAMRVIHLILPLLFLPLAALAQSYSNAPMVVVGDGAPAATTKPATTNPVPGAGFPNFPENAITRVGENTTGQHIDAPANPPSPVSPAAAPSGPAATTPANPSSPASPKSPINKLWPRNTVEIFMPPCTGLRPQFFVPCTCVISKLMLTMPHDEFLAESEAGTIENDPRLIRIRTDCATAPQKKE